MKTIRQILATYRSNDNNYTIDEAEKELLDLFSVSQRSELLKAEGPERSFDEYLKKYFSEPKIELVYKTLYDGKERTEKEVIRMYKKAHRL